jgi:hypothetical protein
MLGERSGAPGLRRAWLALYQPHSFPRDEDFTLQVRSASHFRILLIRINGFDANGLHNGARQAGRVHLLRRPPDEPQHDLTFCRLLWGDAGAVLDGPSGRLRPSGDGGATGLFVAGLHAGFTKKQWINQSFAIHGLRGFISSMTC